MAILSPSILSCDYMNMERDFTECKNMGVKWLHVDVMDGIFVPNITFGMGLAGCALLFLIYKENQYITLFLAALITGLMHGVNYFLICIVPARFEKYNAVSTMSGVINSLTYVGSAAATYGFGAISDNFGWNTVLVAWVIVAVIGTICCFVVIKPWKKFTV